MPKPTPLNTNDMAPAISNTPAAATAPRATGTARRKGTSVRQLAPKNDTPLQVRWPAAEVKALKVAAAQHDETLSDFMLACFHEYMRSQR